MSSQPSIEWRAKWIWDEGDPRPVNAYRWFRKSFIPSTARATAYICADTRYKLYVNGEYVSQGPAPCAPGHHAYDEVGVTLTPGVENIVLVVVNYIGTSTFAYYRNRGGLLFQMGDVVSDDSWLVAKCAVWLSDVPRLAVQQGFAEYYDARQEPANLFAGPIVGADWDHARVVCAAEGGADWRQLEPRGIPQTEWTIYDDARMLEIGSAHGPLDADVGVRMTSETILQLSHGIVNRVADGVVIETNGEDVSALYDFGKEVSGFVRLTVRCEAEGGCIDIGYSESLRIVESSNGLVHCNPPGENCLSYADKVILRKGVTTFENFGHRAFRFVRLVFRDQPKPLKLTELSIRESTYPVNRRGSFASSDDRLNQIWEIGRRTLQLCMDDRYMDCPWRERAQWVGDARVEAMGAWYCFGDTLLHRRLLTQLALSQYPDGHLDPVGPGEWEDHSPNFIAGFACIWIHSIWDNYQIAGDAELLKSLLPCVERVLDWLGTFGKGEGGLLVDVKGWNFTDWAEGLINDNEGLCAPVNLFYMRALEVASDMARVVGAHSSEPLADRALLVRAAFERVFWDEARGVYADKSDASRGIGSASQQTNSLVLLYKVADEDRRLGILSRLLDNPALTQVGSPYFSFYLVSALWAYNRQDDAMAYIRKHWGRMMDEGATSWWEEYHGKTSRCHAWSIGPTIDAFAQILGIGPAEPGYGAVRIAPKLCDLTWAMGMSPHPQGDLNVRVENSAREFVLHVVAPRSVKLIVSLPAADNDTLTIDGVAPEPGMALIRRDGELEVTLQAEQGHRFVVCKAQAAVTGEDGPPAPRVSVFSAASL